MHYPSAEANQKELRDMRKAFFVLDFYCPQLRLCIELDGTSHDHKQEYDEQRSAYLLRQGITVVRYQNEQVYCNPQSIVDDIVMRYGVREGGVTPGGFP